MAEAWRGEGESAQRQQGQVLPEPGPFRQLGESACGLHDLPACLPGVRRPLMSLSARRASDVAIPILQPGTQAGCKREVQSSGQGDCASNTKQVRLFSQGCWRDEGVSPKHL